MLHYKLKYSTLHTTTSLDEWVFVEYILEHLKDGSTIIAKSHDGQTFTGRVTKLFTFEGFEKKAVSEATTGDIVMLAGIPEIYIGHTLVDDVIHLTLSEIHVDEPTLSLNMFVNDSPFGGKTGKFLTSRQIRDRLEKELEINVGLKVDFGNGAELKVFGRGELHLAVLLEQMRREGFEMAVSQPEIIVKEIDGVKCEPFEEATVLVPDEFKGAIIEKLGNRKGIMMDMKQERGQTRMLFEIPTRGLLGYRNEFIIDTKGEGILTSVFVQIRMRLLAKFKKQNTVQWYLWQQVKLSLSHLELFKSEEYSISLQQQKYMKVWLLDILQKEMI
jgi:GTP-binding protein